MYPELLVSADKAPMSSASASMVSDGFVDLRAMAERTSFEDWSEELGQIAG